MRKAIAKNKFIKSKTYVIRDDKQMTSLRAASRQETLDALASMGPVSVPELAAVLGRPPDSLYYHIRILQKVGLVQDAGVRECEGRKERLVRAVAPDLRLSYVPGSGGNAEEVTAIVDSMLRLTSRDFEDAFQNENTVVEGPDRELWAARTIGWLTKDQLVEMNRRITQLLQMMITSPPRSGEQLFALSVVMTPLQRSKENHDA